MLEYFSLKKQAGTVVRQIMVATDGSGGADRAVDFVAELAKAAGCALSIITIGGNLSGEELRQLAHDVGCSIGDVLDSLSGPDSGARAGKCAFVPGHGLAGRTAGCRPAVRGYALCPAMHQGLDRGGPVCRSPGSL